MNDHSYKLPLFCQLPNSNLLPCHYLLSREMPLVNLWPLGPFSINTCSYNNCSFIFPLLFCRFTILLSHPLFAFNLVTSKMMGIDNPLAKLGASFYFVCVQVTAYTLLAC